MSIDHGKVLALADAPPIPAWLIDADQSRVWAAAWETLYRAITLAQPAEAVEYDDEIGTDGKPTGYWIRRSATDAAQGAVAWTVFDAKGVRFTLYNRELAEAIAERGLLVLPMLGSYEWFDAKVDVWKPIDRLPYTWERELGIKWRARYHPKASPTQGAVEGLHPRTADLVSRFAKALSEKLAADLIAKRSTLTDQGRAGEGDRG